MAEIKSIADIGKKFIDVTPGRATQYGEGVKKPKKDWEQSTAAAEDNFEAGITAAISRKSFGKGVREAGNSKYQKGVLEKGISRWPVGIRLALAAYVKGFGPYRDVIERTELPQRYPRRDPRNLDRVAALNRALGEHFERQGS
ncbi:hypothetical protein LCGC14_0972660 [marine sediment metagenome]|uniref:Uncharacterized protein n=1 Tax=marine sediment metagenome TaxID=412755 RepID=A0A0F9QUF8_9ZZZZ